MKVGFIGLGTMGSGMAFNLAKSSKKMNYKLIVYDKNHAVLDKFEKEGVEVSKNIYELLDSDYLMLCLPNESSVKEVLFDEKGLLKGAKKGQIIIDFSTLFYQEARYIYKNCRENKIYYLDAPISGHQKKSKEGTLTIMCGGDKSIFNKVKPLLKIVGNKVLYMGGSGSGQIAKMINNCILNICVASFSELMPLGVKLGLDPKNLGQVIINSTGSSYAAETLVPKVLKGEFDHGFTLSEAYKDMENIFEVTIDQEVPLPTLNGTMQSYQLALQHGQGKYYKQAMIKFYEDMMDVQVRE